MGILGNDKPKTEIKPPIKDDDAPKPIRGEELDKVFKEPEPPERLVVQAKPKASSTVRLTTFAVSNWDLVALSVLCCCVFVLGYLTRCLQDNLTSDQIRLGLEAFIEILIAVFFTSGAVVLKLLTNKGAVAQRFTASVSSFWRRIQTRKEGINKGDVSEWGVSLKPREKRERQ